MRERECSARVVRSKAVTVVEWYVSGAKDRRFIGREFHKRGEELRNERSANLSLEEKGGRERHR